MLKRDSHVIFAHHVGETDLERWPPSYRRLSNCSSAATPYGRTALRAEQKENDSCDSISIR